MWQDRANGARFAEYTRLLGSQRRVLRQVRVQKSGLGDVALLRWGKQEWRVLKLGLLLEEGGQFPFRTQMDYMCGWDDLEGVQGTRASG